MTNATPTAFDGRSRFSSSAFPGRDRFERWREVVRSEFVNSNYESPLGNDLQAVLRKDTVGQVMAFGLWGNSGSYARTKSVCEASDDFLTCIKIKHGKTRVPTPAGIVTLSPGTVIICDAFSPVNVVGEGFCSTIGAAVPGPVFRSLVRSGAGSQPLVFSPNAFQTRLLTQYLELTLRSPPADPETRLLVGQHLSDLAIAAMQSLLPGAEESLQRGQRAARLRVAKEFVLRHLAEPELNAESAAQPLSISSRAVQLLFEAEGTTFSSYVLEQRLLHAFSQLRDPRRDTLAVSQIAYAAGFVDLSHFNRCFRRRFGDTPTGARRGDR